MIIGLKRVSPHYRYRHVLNYQRLLKTAPQNVTFAKNLQS